jgi:hypothetical protein
MSVQHDASDRCDCDGCRPSKVLDGDEMIAEFKKRHGLKSDELAKALQFIETFRPLARAVRG